MIAPEPGIEDPPVCTVVIMSCARAAAILLTIGVLDVCAQEPQPQPPPEQAPPAVDPQPPLPTGVGNEIMAAFALPPSRLIGDIKRALEAAIEAGEVEARLEPGAYVEFVAKNRARFGI